MLAMKLVSCVPKRRLIFELVKATLFDSARYTENKVGISI